MIKLLLILFFHVSIFGHAYAQKNSAIIEINPFFRWDTYPKFTYAINPVNSYKVVIKGQSWGTNLSYKFPVSKNYLSVGLGYYRHSFNKITQINSLINTPRDNRVIDYVPDGPYVPSITFSTDKYWYNTLSLNVGFEKNFAVSKTTKLLTGINLNNYFTFSQNYHITYPREGTDYRTSRFKFFGLSTNLSVGLQKTIGKIALAPIVILPVCDVWKKDKVFPQEESENYRSKWFNGVGAGVSIRYFLTQN